jgi:membrane protein DedA with SNARE-associated domain
VVFFGRFVTVLRTGAAFFAGLSRMRWSRFAMANAAGGLLWSAGWAFGAYALGGAATQVGSVTTIAGLAVTAALALVLALVMRRLTLWVPNIASPHATCEYSWIRPPSRSRRTTRTFAPKSG